MASKTALKIQRDKEIAAMMYNTKEDRVLEKSLQTLRLEQTYALKLLELDHRIIKVRYKKLKEKVSKIKSHLPADDISSFRDLDLQGKLGPSQHGGVNLGSAIKIAAAARRLNLGTGSRRRVAPRSALPIISVQRENRPSGLELSSKSAVSINDPPVVERIKRANSVTGVFIDAPDPSEAGKNRPSSAFTTNSRLTNRLQTVNGLAVGSLENNNTNDRKLSNNSNGNHRPSSTTARNVSSLSPQMHQPEPNVVTTEEDSSRALKLSPEHGFTSIKETLSVPSSDDGGRGNGENEGEDSGPDPMPTFRSASSTLHRSRSPFSSHTTRETRHRLASAPVRQKRRLSYISTDSIDSNLGESSQEERRQELLEEEGMRAVTLDQRTKLFLKDVDDYLQKNPPLQASHVAFENGIPEPPRKDSLVEPASGQDAGGNLRSTRLRQRRGDALPGEEQDITPTFFPEAQYKERLMGLWKDMNKCRYLRVPDEKIDLSGVNTLVQDQMKMFETLKNAERTPLRQAWEM